MTMSAPTTKRLRVQAVVSGRTNPSSRFRVLQYVPALARLGVDVDARPPRIGKYASLHSRWRRRPALGGAMGLGLSTVKLGTRVPAVLRSWRADVTWLEREMLPGALSLEPVLGRPILFDVDDAVWLLSDGHERAVRAICRLAACAVAGNDYLAEWLSRTGVAVEKVWTAIDTDRFTFAERSGESGFTIGWTGSASTLPYLESIASPLADFLRRVPDSRLVVMADRSPRLPGVPAERTEFVPWSPQAEAAVVRRFDVGLMPLPDSPWGRGKCAFKLLQYLASGVPAVASPVGMSAEVLAMAQVGLAASEEADWTTALHELHADAEGARAMGDAGRRLVEERFSQQVIAPRLASIMRRIG
ncbi:MAG TPA: glycosyltransferase [Acidimicrobiales bacterium]|nr:glycosyltransferase [Acidimicrobiales bacterium]